MSLVKSSKINHNNTIDSKIDILNGNLPFSIINFTIPIAVSGILQQFFNAADTTVVGHFAEADALAAVGTNSELVALIVTISSGLSIGSNVLIAKFIGENRKSEFAKAISSSLIFALIIGFLGLTIGLLTSKEILTAINAPKAVFDMALSYLRIYFLGYPFLVLYDFCSAIFRAFGDTKKPFIVLMFSGIVNVILNLIFVIVFHKGVVGVAIATSFANFFSAVTMLSLLLKENKIPQIEISLKCIKNILVIGVPAAIQGAVFCFANLFITASVNSFGEVASSGSTISINYEYFSYYIISAFGQTATTFTSQNYAANKLKRCKEIFTYCLIFDIIFTAAMTIPLYLFSHFFAAIFSNDSNIIEMASVRIKIVLLIEPICGIFEVEAGALRAKGYSIQPALITMGGICLIRILYILTLFKRIHTLEALFIIFPVSWIITVILMTFLYYILSKKQYSLNK